MDIYDDDIDGIPMTNDDDDIDGVPIDDSKSTQRAFIPSKWETVDPDQIEAQAVTTSKWDSLPVVAPDPPKIVAATDSDSSDSNLGYEDERRTILREIEVKTMQYQDDLEAGRRSLKSGFTLIEQVQNYRKKLIKKVKRKQDNSSDSSERESRYREPSPPVISSGYTKKAAKRSKRSPSSPATYDRDYDRSNSPRSTHSYKSRSPILSRRQESDSPQSSSHSSSRRYKERPGRSRSRSPHRELSEKSLSRRYERDISPGRRYKSPSPSKSSSRFHESISRDRYASSSSSSSHKKHKRSKY